MLPPKGSVITYAAGTHESECREHRPKKTPNRNHLPGYVLDTARTRFQISDPARGYRLHRRPAPLRGVPKTVVCEAAANLDCAKNTGALGRLLAPSIRSKQRPTSPYAEGGGGSVPNNGEPGRGNGRVRNRGVVGGGRRELAPPQPHPRRPRGGGFAASISSPPPPPRSAGKRRPRRKAGTRARRGKRPACWTFRLRLRRSWPARPGAVGG